jgi:asparagine synthase (glutamine-hydrolysing)
MDISRQQETVQTMVNSLRHRGPDATGLWIAPHAILGHSRLIVVDPQGGQQPMTRSHQGRDFTITYNGELYNTLELRRSLENRGYIFQSRNSDTEVVLLSYIEWGADCVHRFNGIYAFAIWDEGCRDLFMARDRLGVKPLFYTRRDRELIFASELKALLVHPGVKAAVDARGLAEIFALGPARTPGQGVFKGLDELKAAHCLNYNPEGLKISRYWQLVSRPHEDDVDTTAAYLRFLFQDTVVRQLGADVPVCTLLSGGLDSSAITAMAQVYGDSQNTVGTFSVDYVDSEVFYRPNSFESSYDQPWAERVSNCLGTRHHHIIIDNAELAEALYPSLLAHDLPGMTDIDSSLYLFCREVRKHAVVALSGECADEILGGYPWFNSSGQGELAGFPWIRNLKERTQFLSDEILNKILPLDYVRERYREALAEVPGLEGEEETEARRRELFYLNITRFMPTLLDRKDRMSMAWGLEVRVPFSDHRLVEYVWNIPWKIKNYNGIAKGILRKALHGLLPDEVLMRRKSPYPKTHHPLYEEAVRRELARIIDNPASPLLDLINVKAVSDLLQRGGRFFNQPWFGQLMGDVQYVAYLIQVNRWLTEYKVEICI